MICYLYCSYNFTYTVLCSASCLLNFFCFGNIYEGRALEELRASMFSNFSSEKAKNMQQRLCTPSVALTFNFVVAIGIIFMNKWVGILLLTLTFFFYYNNKIKFE